MDTRLKNRLYLVAKRLYLFHLGWLLAIVWLLSATVGWSLLQSAERASLPASAMWIWIGLTLAITVAVTLWRRMRFSDLTAIAREIENEFPSLQQRLVTAASIRPSGPSGKFSYLQRTVISEAIRHDFSNGWHSLVPPNRMAISWCSCLLALVCLLAIGANWWSQSAEPITLNPVTDLAVTSELPIVAPGDTEVELGSSVIVTAKFGQNVPDEVWLVAKSATAENKLPMKRSLGDPIFASHLYDMREPTTYRVIFDEKETSTYKISVFEYPSMVRADAKLEYPTYIGMESKMIADTRRVSAVVGTQLTWQLYLNKPVASAELIETDNPDTQPIKLVSSADTVGLVEGGLTLTESKTWKLKLVDQDGRTNQQEVTLRAKAIPNESAKIKLVAGGDVLVSPLQEFDVGAKVNDDFGIEKVGIGYQFAGGEIVEIEATPTQSNAGEKPEATPAQKPSKEVKFSNLIDLEALKAETNQLLSYYVWAEERDESGELRRTVSDIFFAEVRPLEEIFRQGEQPNQEQQRQQQQGQQGSEETEELLELQKQIIAGTWNVVRTARNGKLPDRAVEDLKLLADSQTSAIEKLAEQAEGANVPGADEYLQNAAKYMQNAADQLVESGLTLKPSDVQKALGSEQAAYQELLRLQSREHEVTRSQQSQSQSQRSQRSRNRQQQLDQLELKNEQNRYESERVAQEQQTEEQSAMRQVISRLRELAARQEDLNEQLREIEAALQAAKTEKEREELQRQLERLREQQQQMLQDSDELQERMESQSSSEAMQSAQQQMQQTRENLQQSAEALNQGNTSQALSSGTRAEQQLNELRDEMREQAANQFSEAMKEMQQEASDIEQRQKEIVEQMNSTESQPSAGLRSNEEPSNAESKVAQQAEQVKELLNEIEQTVQQAEEAEPLLAQKLYDTYRKAKQQKVEERVKVTEQLLERNMDAEARKMADESLREVTELRKEIDQAAEAIVGNEEDSLRLALNQIETLEKQLNNERPGGSGAPENSAEQQNQRPSDSTAASNQQPSNQQGQQPGQQSAQAQEERGQQDQQQGQQQGQKQGQPNGQPGQTPSQSGENGQPSESQTRNGQPSTDQQPRSPMQPGLRGSDDGRTAPTMGGGFEDQAIRPFTGEGFREWSDRLRDVEELVTDPDLRWQATQIRQAARELRVETQRHAELPEWSLVEKLVAGPLRELQQKVSAELIRKAASKNEIVPIDRDPVPSEFSRSVRQYYENLGSGR